MKHLHRQLRHNFEYLVWSANQCRFENTKIQKTLRIIYSWKINQRYDFNDPII